jgi:hypothetical protein
VVDDRLDELLPLEMPDSNASQAAVDFEALDENALADEFEGGDFLQDTVVGGLVEDDGVLGLVLDLSLGPLLLLRGFTTAGGSGGCFCFGLWEEVPSAVGFHQVHPESKWRIQLFFLRGVRKP